MIDYPRRRRCQTWIAEFQPKLKKPVPMTDTPGLAKNFQKLKMCCKNRRTFIPINNSPTNI